MMIYLGLISLLLLFGLLAATAILALLSACEEITCGFGPLGSGHSKKREARRMMGQTCDLQRRSAPYVQVFDDYANGYFSPKIIGNVRRAECPASVITSL